MSTDRRTIDAWSGVGHRLVVDGLEHELLGIHPRRTRFALASIVGLVALIVASYASAVVTVGGAALDTHTPSFDALSAVVIVIATATLTAVPLVYAAWNGGPGLSFAMPVVPVVVGELLAGRYVLGLDAAIALTVGAVAAALALYSADVREAGSLRPWRTRAPAECEDRLLFVTAVSTVALVATVSFVTTVPPHVRTWYVPFQVLWLVSIAIAGAYWGTWLRSAFQTVRDRRPADS